MPVQLLPASAAAFAPRASSVNVVLANKVEPWLTLTLKRISRVKRPLNSVPQHQRCLVETLSSPDAIWTLASLMLPKLPDADMPDDALEHLFAHRLVHVEAYIVHVDMVLRNEVAYKLTADTIDALVDYHRDIHGPNAKAATYDWPDKAHQSDRLHNDFVHAVNRFVFRTHVSALEGLEEDGAGELLCGKSLEVKTSLMNLMKPLLPPPPRVVDVVRQPPLLPSSPAAAAAAAAAAAMWSQQPAAALHALDAWRVLPSSPVVPSTSADSSHTPPLWAAMPMPDVQMASPSTAALTQPPPPSTAAFFYTTPAPAPVPALPLPSMLAPSQCGVGAATPAMGSFAWDRYHEYAAIM